MGKPSVQALPAERWRVPAWLAEAGGALASIVLPAGAGCASNYSLEGRDYLWCARMAWLRFADSGKEQAA
jgi:hypothetical protein